MRLQIPFARYAWHSGTLAWLFHRISGAALTFYLVLHIWVTHHVGKSPEEFDALMKLFTTPLFKIGEIGILAAIIYHGLNGVRVILVDLGIGVRHQEKMFLAVFVVSFMIISLGAVIIFPWEIFQLSIFKGLLPT